MINRRRNLTFANKQFMVVHNKAILMKIDMKTGFNEMWYIVLSEKKDGNKDIKVKGTNINNIPHKRSANFETITENHII